MMGTRSGSSLEGWVAWILRTGTAASVGLVAVGVLLMAASGRSPLDVGPAFDPARLARDIVRLQPAGFLWLGVLLALATPTARVVVALVGFVRKGERELAGVAVLILSVIVLGVIVGMAGG